MGDPPRSVPCQFLDSFPAGGPENNPDAGEPVEKPSNETRRSADRRASLCSLIEVLGGGGLGFASVGGLLLELCRIGAEIVLG